MAGDGLRVRIYLKCQYCHHAIGAKVSLTEPKEGDKTTFYHAPPGFVHHDLPYQAQIERGGPLIAFHNDCEEAYLWWRRLAMDHRSHCHKKDCDNVLGYPFRRFSLPFNITPTKLGDPIPIPEKERRLLRL